MTQNPHRPSTSGSDRRRDDFSACDYQSGQHGHAVHGGAGALLHIVLSGITAGEGLGFNRGFCFLVNSDRTFLEGRMGLGRLTRGMRHI
jgi:hypothetical protein